jgi:ribosomal protein S27E
MSAFQCVLQPPINPTNEIKPERPQVKEMEYLPRDEGFVYLKCPMCSKEIYSAVSKPISPRCHSCGTHYELDNGHSKINILQLIKEVHVKTLRAGKLKRYLSHI